MNHSCSDIQQWLLTDERPDEVRNHLRQCDDCRDFAAFCATIAEPPAALDAQVRAHAHARPVEAPRPRLLMWQPIAAAAAFALLIGVSILLTRTPPQPPTNAAPPAEIEAPAVPAEELLAWEFELLDDAFLRLETNLVLMENVVNAEAPFEALIEENPGS